MKRSAWLVAPLLGALALAGAVSPARAVFVDFFVDSTLDQVDIDGLDGICRTVANTCTLRAAVMQANRTGGFVRIYLPAGTFTLTRPPDAANADDSGDLNFTPNSTAFTSVYGVDSSSTIVDANQLDRAFRVESNRGAGLFSLTVRNGSATIGGGVRADGGIYLEHARVEQNHAQVGGGVWGGTSSLVQIVYSVVTANQAVTGGGVWGESTLVVTHSAISGNSAAGDGGGIYAALGFSSEGSTISGNSAAGDGGGVYSLQGSQATDTAISGNSSGGDGGGLYAAAGFAATGCTVSGNTAAGDGGGVYAAASAAPRRFISSTLSGNRADGSGGGLALPAGTVDIYSSTIAFNRADWNVDGVGWGGGLFVDGVAEVNIRNCLVVGNAVFGAPLTPSDCAGMVNYYGRNLFSTPVGCVNVVGTGAGEILNDLTLVGPLANNGGLTKTHALLPGSNAIDYADPLEGCLGPEDFLLVDQRGAPRYYDDWCDVGAYESGPLFLDGFSSGDSGAWSTTLP